LVPGLWSEHDRYVILTGMPMELLYFLLAATGASASGWLGWQFADWVMVRRSG